MAFPSNPSNGDTHTAGGVTYVYDSTPGVWKAQTFDTVNASEALTKIKTVDGSGSGLDADTLDGLTSGQFVRGDANNTISGDIISTGTIQFNGGTDAGADVAIGADGEVFYIFEPEDSGGTQSPLGGRQWLKMGDDSSGEIDIYLGDNEKKVWKDGDYIEIPSSSTAPSSPSTGTLWFDGGSENALKVYNGTSWDTLSNKMTATGGTITQVGGYTIHTFTSSGTFELSGSGNVEYLVIAGGGAGSKAHSTNVCGGGGAGGYRTNVTGQSSGGGASAEGTMFLSDGSYSVTIGGGGTCSTASGNQNGSSGSSSSFNGISCVGGGGGGYFGTSTTNGARGKNGGSGGGAGSYNGSGTQNFPGGSGTSGQGYNGAAFSGGSSGGGGGGGGASETPPAQGGTLQGGRGGNGLSSNITGSSVTRAGGGGGSGWQGNAAGSGGTGGGGNGAAGENTTAQAGSVNTGSGGGAAKGSGVAGNGGSGIVIIRYQG